METRTDIITELQNIVKTDRQKWADDAFERAIGASLRDFADARPLTGTSTLQLKSGCRQYAAPECMIDYIGSEWGMQSQGMPWDAGYPGALPRIYMANSVALGRVIEFSPAPTAKHITAYGMSFDYAYKSKHILIDDEDGKADGITTTLHETDHDLFITRCLAALMRDLIARNVTSPIQLQKGMSNLPNSATPSHAYERLMADYRSRV